MLAWVTLWRPGELLLDAWYPFTRDATLCGKLERSDIHIFTEAEDTRR